MADYWPNISNNNWSVLSNWLTATGVTAGNLPTINDDVYADNKTVYIDINAQANTVRTTARSGGTAGGSFIINNGVSLSANVIAGTTTCVTFPSAAPNTCTLFGGITGGTGTNIYGFNNNSTGTAFIYGLDAFGGTGTTAAGVNNNSTGNIFLSAAIKGGRAGEGLNNRSTGFVSITGDVFGSQLGGNIIGINNSGTCTVYGNVIGGPPFAGGAGGNAFGINHASATGVLTVYGNVSGARFVTILGYGVYNSNIGTVNIFGDSVGTGAYGTWNNSTGIINIVGNCVGGTAAGANNNSSGTLNVLGNVFGGSGTTTTGAGVVGTSTGTTSITGNVIGGSSSVGIANNSTGTVTLYGNVSGGTGQVGAYNNSTGRMFIYGSAKASNTQIGANNVSTGLLYITKVIGNDYGAGTTGVVNSVVGASNSQNGLMYVEQFEFGLRGQTPISGPVFILPSNRNTLTGYTTAAGQTVTFYNSLSIDGLLPPTSSVRVGTVYNVGNSIGTMQVPSANSVQFGVPVDNTIGTATLTPQDVWGYSRLSATQVNSMGDRLRNTATTQSVGYQIASFNL